MTSPCLSVRSSVQDSSSVRNGLDKSPRSIGNGSNSDTITMAMSVDLAYIKILRTSSFFACAGFRLNNAWANDTVLRPFLQPESPLSSQEFGLWLEFVSSAYSGIRTHDPHVNTSPSNIRYPQELLVLISTLLLLPWYLDFLLIGSCQSWQDWGHGVSQNLTGQGRQWTHKPTGAGETARSGKCKHCGARLSCSCTLQYYI